MGVAQAESRVRAEHKVVPTVLRSVRVFDSEAGRVGAPQDVWIAPDGTIDAVTSPGERAPVKGTREIEAERIGNIRAETPFSVSAPRRAPGAPDNAHYVNRGPASR
ncbi:MAG: hypothetical protein GY898_19500 [Proteobacteria bacterium]|nr:hypothetical protein [Pseudomonadota bacterium]